MIGNGLLNDRVKCYAYSDVGAGTSYTAPRYLYQGSVFGYLSRVRGSQPYTAVVAGQVIDAVLFVRNTAPVSQDGVVSVDGVYYQVLAVLCHKTQERYECPLRHVERAKIAADDASVATVIITPAAVSVPHGTPNALGVATIALADVLGYPLTGRYVTLNRTAGASTVTAVVRGAVVDLHTIPNAPASGDQFTLSAEGHSAVLAVTVT